MQISKPLLINILKSAAIGSSDHGFDVILNKTEEMIRELESLNLKDGEMEILEIIG